MEAGRKDAVAIANDFAPEHVSVVTKEDEKIGGGVEFLRHERWLLRAEALYVDLGSEKQDYTITTCIGVCTTSVDWKDSFWTARVGLSYKFGGHAEHHESMK